VTDDEDESYEWDYHITNNSFVFGQDDYWGLAYFAAPVGDAANVIDFGGSIGEGTLYVTGFLNMGPCVVWNFGNEWDPGLERGESADFWITTHPTAVQPAMGEAMDPEVATGVYGETLSPGSDNNLGAEEGPQPDLDTEYYFWNENTPAAAPVAGPTEGAQAPPAAGATSPTIKFTKATNADVVTEWQGEAAAAKTKIRNQYLSWYGVNLEDANEVAAATANNADFWKRVIKEKNGIIRPNLQTQVRFSVDNFANAPDKNNSFILQTVKIEMFGKSGAETEFKLIETHNVAEGFAVDQNGVALKLDIHRLTQGALQGGDAKVVMSFKVGWGQYKNGGFPGGGPGGQIERKTNQELPAADYKFTGPTREYTVTFTVDRNGNWTINDGSIGLTKNGGPTEVR
jgi:hypothetical protein